MSTYVNLGNGTVTITISELEKMKSLTEKLIEEIKANTQTIIQQSRSVANWASSEYGSRVSGSVSTVLNQCSRLSTEYTAALSELGKMVSGIDKVIAGYETLELDLAQRR